MKTTQSSYARVYISYELAHGKLLQGIHLFDIRPGKTDSDFWKKLREEATVDLVPFGISEESKAGALLKHCVDPDDNTALLSRALENIYLNTRLSLLGLSAHDQSVSKSGLIIKPEGLESACFLNSSSKIAFVECEDGVHSFDDKGSGVDNQVKILVPKNESFTIYGDAQFSLLTSYEDDSVMRLLETVSHLHKLLDNRIERRERILAESEVRAYKSSVENFEEYLGHNRSADKIGGSGGRFENVLFCAGLIIRRESRATRLYTSVNLSNCKSEQDALLRLLDVSSVSYRISVAPEKVSDNRSYLFLSDDGGVSAYIRYGLGYRIVTSLGSSSCKDGVHHAMGQILTIYPKFPEEGNAWDFARYGLRDTVGAFLSVLLISLVLSAATLIPAILVTQLTSLYIPFGDYYSLLFFGASAVLALSLVYIIQLLQARYLVRFEVVTDSNLQTMIVDRFLRVKLDEASLYSPGSLQNRIMGISDLRSTITSNLTPILTAFLSVVFNFVYLFIYSWQLSLIVMCSGLVLGIATLIGAFQRLKYFRELTELDGKLLETTNDSISGVSAARTAGTSRHLLLRFSEVISPLLDAVFGAVRVRNRVDTLSGATTYILYIFLLPYAYHLAHSENAKEVLTVGGVVSFLTCTQTFLASFESAIDKSITSFVRLSVYWSRAMEVVSLPSEPGNIEKTPSIFNGSLSASELTFGYRAADSNNRLILSDVALELNSGEAAVIVGEPRSGKTTLLEVLSGLHDSYSGNIIVSGHDLKTISPRIYRSFLGNVPQNLQVRQGTIFDNICHGIDVGQGEVDQCLKDFSLDEFISSLPLKLGTIISPHASTVPDIYKKRMFLVRAALRKSRYVFIDDILSGLDLEEVGKIISYFKRNGSSILATTSDSSIIECFDKHYKLR